MRGAPFKGWLDMITGKDDLSKHILLTLDQGTKVKDLPEMYSISIDQAKRLSRFHNMLNATKGNISSNNHHKLQELGLKSLLLSPRIKANDWEAVEEILLSVTSEVRRDDLKKLILAVEEKRKRINDFQVEVDRKIESLEEKNAQIEERKTELIKLQKQIQKEAKFLEKYEPEVQSFLLDHVGLSRKEKRLILAKRLDVNWQRNLRKKGIIEFIDEPDFSKIDKQKDYYIYVIHDLDYIAEDLKKRWERGWDCEWDYEKAAKQSSWATPTSEYRNADGLATDLKSRLKELQNELKQIEEEKKQINDEMKNLRKQSPKSFIESVEASNKLSEIDLIKHGELQEKGLKWLFDKGYVCTAEFTLPNRRRADVIGYNEHGRIIILEVKVNQSDYDRDDKWETYLPYCDEFYFLLDSDIVHFRKEYNGGLILSKRNGRLEVKRGDRLERDELNKDGLMFSIATALTRKNLVGY